MRHSLLKKILAIIALGIAGLGLGSTFMPTELLAQVQHRSYFRVPEGGTSHVALGLNKSMIVELPREAREVMVSNPDQMDAVLQSSTRAYLIGKKLGEANVIFVDEHGNPIATLEVTIQRDLAALQALIARLIHGSHVRVESIGANVLLTGTVPTPLDATRTSEIVRKFLYQPEDNNKQGNNSKAGGTGSSITISNGNDKNKAGDKAADANNRVINMITVEGREQVLLKVSVVEMRRNIVKQFGVDLDALVKSGNFAFSALSQLPFPLSGGAAVGTANFGTGWSDGTSNVNGVLHALEQDGLIHTLAEPNLTAISGETANFLAGGEFPIPISQQFDQISVEFKKFGIALAFTPVVMTEGLISLKISTEVSELTNEGAVVLRSIRIPALKVRRAETVVELPSGGSLVIAGLLSDQSRQALSGYPGLKNLPVLGTLFRSRDWQKDETELVVLVTPYIVKPVAQQKLAKPDEGFAWASDVSTDLLGKMNRVYGRHPEIAPAGKFTGDVGFIIK